MARTGAGGSGEGAEGRVQGWLRNGDRKGPAGGGVDVSDASLAAASAAATASPTAVPSVIWGVSQTPTVCWALCGTQLARKCLLLWGSCSDHRDSKQNKICVMLDVIRGSKKGEKGIWEWRDEGCHFKWGGRDGFIEEVTV